MRKTLLIAAAALASSVISSQAQVYSQNIVGYVNIPLTAGVLQVVAPALDLDGTGTNNTVGTVFGTNNPTIGDVVYVFNGLGYDTLNFKTAGHGSTVANWYLGANIDNSYPINPGESVFYAPAATETNTQVGIVMQGTNLTNAYLAAAGQISLVASIVPIGGGVTTALTYNPSIGDVIYIYNGAGYDTYNYKTAGHGSTVGNWYNGATIVEPQIAVGSGFWLVPATSTNWVESFVSP